MEAPIKLLVLKTGTVLIGQVSEVSAELGDANCKLTKPFEIIRDDCDQYNLVKWLNNFTDKDVFLIQSENILTITDPKKEHLKIYVDLIT